MALRTYVNGAWEDIADLQTPNVNGAREQAETARAYVNNAWEDVLDNGSNELVTYSNDIANAKLTVSDDGNEMELFKWMDGNEGSLSGGGTIVLAVEGEWTNPTIEFEYEGMMARFSSDRGTWWTASAGDVSIFTKNSSGTTNTVSAVTSIGVNKTGSTDTDNMPDPETGTYTTTLSGKYKQLGLSVKFNGWNNTFYGADNTLIVRSVIINGEEIRFSQECEFNNMIW